MKQELARMNDLMGTLLTGGERNRDLIADLGGKYELQQEKLERKTRKSSEKKKGLN